MDLTNQSMTLHGSRQKVNERYVQKYTEKMCGEPKKYFIKFNSQQVEQSQKKDQTLGKYLMSLTKQARQPCKDCRLDRI